MKARMRSDKKAGHTAAEHLHSLGEAGGSNPWYLRVITTSVSQDTGAADPGSYGG